ncbi:O-antigen ligase family protein [Neisseria weaveri]|uniref:O-antigen ligase family protein n=1 Tax=Neisseria weaveri TaxID=28091 RepID=UPI0007C9AD5C|nr:O-antigen ligase family protein [Neisseria weaveri]SAY50225.1 Lipid A core-O-antigen ligase and related enzymes [Neisseria weaveri]
MKIKRQKLYIGILYTMLAGYMLGPALNYLVGIPRIDNPMTVLFLAVTALIAFAEKNRLRNKTIIAFLAVSAMSLWGGIHLLLSPLEPTQIVDILFFATLPGFFYLFYLVISREQDKLKFIRKFLFVFAMFICIPPVIEIATGIPLVGIDDEVLALDAGIIKGLFFNPNNLSTVAVCTSAAILFFFHAPSSSRKESLFGWLLFLMLGLVVIASASRTATLIYSTLFMLNLVYMRNGLLTLMSVSIAAIALTQVPKIWIQNLLLSLNGNVFLENISNRLYLFLFELESDKSVSYRQEIYDYFLQNPPLLFIGYGPKDFAPYFSGNLSDSLGFHNPHSFIIELYLGFGLISLLGFAIYIAVYCLSILSNRYLGSKQRFIAMMGIAIFILAGFIPSTILRMPFLWFPCFLMLVYSLATSSRKQ